MVDIILSILTLGMLIPLGLKLGAALAVELAKHGW